MRLSTVAILGVAALAGVAAAAVQVLRAPVAAPEVVATRRARQLPMTSHMLSWEEPPDAGAAAVPGAMAVMPIAARRGEGSARLSRWNPI